MANYDHLKLLKQDVGNWNRWREANMDIRPDLGGADLTATSLGGADLSGANLSGADLNTASLNSADLKFADLRNAKLYGTDLSFADLRGADLGGVEMDEGLWVSEWGGGRTIPTNLSSAKLSGAKLSNSVIAGAIFANVDLSEAIGLETVKHWGPSTIGIDTICMSGGKIPEAFLRGCGVPETFITFAKSLVGKPAEFYSCFISYSTKDEEFANQLHSRLRDAHVRVWFAPEDIKGGVKLYDQIERAIQVHDRLLIVLSENSLRSEWVMTEIRKAREAEKRENRRKLFPIRLADFDQIRNWRCPDADGGKDLAVEVREYFIPDFSNWKDHDSFEKAFERLLRDLREAEDAKEGA
jgi:uncharacterized protein YjbI with pentapeptide repeats